MTIITLNEFKKSMTGEMLEFNNEQLETIYNGINKDEFLSMEELEEYYTDYHENDFSFLHDISLPSLLNDLQYNDFTEKQIIELLNARYGNVLEIYYLQADNVFLLAIGMR